MNHYLITALPRLPELGGPVPMSPADFLEHVAVSKRAYEAARLLFLGSDLAMRDAFRSGEVNEVVPTVLAAAQVRGEAPLPPELAVDADDLSARDETNARWAKYFEHVAARAQALPSPFLAAWVRHEVALRNALVRARAQALGVELTGAYVAPGLGDADVAAVVSQWSAAPNQHAAERVLDLARLQWIDATAPYFSFGDDELAAWAARLLLVRRWHRLGPVHDTPLSTSPQQGAHP